MNRPALNLPCLPKAIFWLIAFAVLMFIPPKGHAQTSDFGWYPGFRTPGASCYLNSTGGTLCSTAVDACQSTAAFYSAPNPPAYAYLIPEGVPFLGTTDIWNSGLACSWLDGSSNLVGGVNELIPTGYVGDSNSPPGYAPPGTATVQTPKQIGGGGCDVDAGGDAPPDDDGQDSSCSEGSDANPIPTPTGNDFSGEPINVPTGNMSYHHTDYRTTGQNALGFTRYYNSRGAFIGPLGVNWRTSYDRAIWLFGGASPYSTVGVQRADGQLFYFTLTSGVWHSDSDVDYTLTNTGTTWVLTDPDDTVETYLAVTTGYAKNYLAHLQTIKKRNGYTKTLAYNSLGQISSVTDSYSRVLTFTYNGNELYSITTPDSTTITYGYSSNSSAAANLTTVNYPTSQTVTYAYGNTSLPHMLTSVIDENNSTFLTWTYDAYGRALTSQVGTGSNATLTTVAYNDTNGSRTVTNALGEVNTYTYSSLQNAQKLSQISRASTSTTAAATRTFTYDSNGYLASSTDWNGNSTTYVNNAHGKPTTINEAVGSTVARSTTIAYDPTWVHLPHTITTPGLTTGFTYDSAGEQLTQVLTDTTTTTIPYSTNGQTRTWTNTWSNALLTSVKTPNNHTTTFGYDSSGALTSITDALSHITHITAHTGGGLPQTITDPNGVITTKAYDQRQRITSSSVATTAGALATTWGYYNSGDVTTTLADGSYIFTLLDNAHRLANIANNYNEQKGWQLDALGDATLTGINDRSGNEAFQRTATFDALGRKLKDTSSTTYASIVRTYDSNGNTLTVADPLSHTTTNVFDALNRLSTSTDANSGIMTITYDAHNRRLTVKDKNGNTTSYVYDGFGDKIQQTSPDSGITVYHYDSDAKLTSKTDAASVVTNWTFDALDRPLTTTYPADTAENVAYTWDQTGHGFGIGRLTSLTDAAGSLSRTYDERGNLLTDARTIGTSVSTTTYTWDKASRIASITYPSGSIVTYVRDSVGQPTTVTAKAPGGTVTNLASSITHEPYGPVTGINAFNGDVEAFTFDLDYRMKTLVTTSVSGGQHQAFVYDSANNLKTLTDTVCSSCSATLGYDVLNRLTSAASWYGTYGYSYDKNGNFLTNGEDGYGATYTISPTSNRISSISVSGTSYPVSYTATGNITSFTRIPGETTTMTYNKANRLATSLMSIASTHVYDAFGQRITKASSGTPATVYTYELGGSLLEENDNGVLYDYIWLDGRLIGTLTPSTNTLAFTHGDKNVSPYSSTDKNGLLSQQYSYTPYGNTGTSYTQPGAATITQNNRFPGHFFDPETLMNHNGFRDYSPQLSRYVESDPLGLGGGLNTYAYANGNPMSNVDPSGLICASQIPGSGDDHPVEDDSQYADASSDLGNIQKFTGGQIYAAPIVPTPTEINLLNPVYQNNDLFNYFPDRQDLSNYFSQLSQNLNYTAAAAAALPPNPFTSTYAEVVELGSALASSVSTILNPLNPPNGSLPVRTPQTPR